MVNFLGKNIQWDRIRTNWPGVYALVGHFVTIADPGVGDPDPVEQNCPGGLVVTYEDVGQYELTFTKRPKHVLGIYHGYPSAHPNESHYEVRLTGLEVEDEEDEYVTAFFKVGEIVAPTFTPPDGPFVAGGFTPADVYGIPVWFLVLCSDEDLPKGDASLLTGEMPFEVP